MKKTVGFSLVELLTVLSIIGILAALAYPSYASYVQRGRLTEATNLLASMRVQLEQFYQDNLNYGSTASACGSNIGSFDGDAFAFTCNYGAGASNQGYLITATGKAAAGMGGFAFTIDHANNRQTTAFPNATGLPKACWIVRAGDAC